MLQIKFGMRTYLNNNKVCIRVYWNNKKCETTFVTGVYAEVKKWDCDMQRAKKHSVHVVSSKCAHHTATANEINCRIAEFKEEIEGAFYLYSLKGSIPDVDELRAHVNAKLGRYEEKPSELVQTKGLQDYLEDFLKKGEREKNWDDQAKEKYTQAMMHFTSANPKVKVNTITIDSMYNLRDWYVKNEYRNRTTNKQFVMLKAVLKYINEQEGCSIPSECLNFETNLKVVKRTVTFMRFNELLAFLRFQFVNCEERLSRVRDLWCFMAFTSLRYSDLVRLKPFHIIDGNRIEMMAEKTDEQLSIPLTDYAQEIIRRRGGEFGPDGLLFDVPTNQQMNSSIKDAAMVAGITRSIVDVYFIGTKRYEESFKFCDIISCHDARRTFVSCSLAMGVPPEVVMKCTGHKDYATMKPYIDTATETQSIEMQKWNKSQYRSGIISLLEKADESQMQAILFVVQEIVVTGRKLSELLVSSEESPAKVELSDKTEGSDSSGFMEYKDMQTEVNPQPNRKRGRPKKTTVVVEESVPVTDTSSDDFSILEAMNRGQLFHVEYDSSEFDEEDLSIIRECCGNEALESIV